MQNTSSLLSRRSVIMSFFTSIFTIFFKSNRVFASSLSQDDSLSSLTNADWKKKLSPEAYNVLRQEGTERPFTSLLNKETREGVFHCAGCELPLFSSTTKFDSGTGWPSFWDHLPGAIATKTDFKLIVPRTEYHCSRCGGHQGHVFNDGPRPTGKRYCNNGIALKFIASS